MRRSVLITGCTTGGTGHALAKEYQSRGTLTSASPEFIDDKMVLAGLLVFATRSTVGINERSCFFTSNSLDSVRLHAGGLHSLGIPTSRIPFGQGE
jgi:hypothetical protein